METNTNRTPEEKERAEEILLSLFLLALNYNKARRYSLGEKFKKGAEDFIIRNSSVLNAITDEQIKSLVERKKSQEMNEPSNCFKVGAVELKFAGASRKVRDKITELQQKGA